MRVKIKDICKIVSGGDKPSTVSTAPTNECNVPIYGNALDKEGLYGFTNFSTIDEEAITIAARGSNCGASFLRKKPFVPIVRLLTLIPDKEKILPEYLYYVIKNTNFKSTGSGQPQITIPQVSECEINITEDINKQKNISAVLYAIDKKIELNKKINDELEAMAKTLYDYWFLQFEFPNEEGNPYKSSGGKMVWNKELKREIPEGWEANSIAKSILKSKNGDWGTDEPTNNDDIKVNCFRGADFISITQEYNMTAPVRYIKKNNADRLLVNGDLITEISGGSPTQSTGRIGYINQGFLNRSENVMDCSNFCKAFTPLKMIYQFWLYQTWKSLYENGAMFNFESKTTGIKNLMFDDFINSILVAYPKEEILTRFQNICEIYYDKIQKSLLENQELAALRDFLLPLLMNGQVGFKK